MLAARTVTQRWASEGDSAMRRSCRSCVCTTKERDPLTSVSTRQSAPMLTKPRTLCEQTACVCERRREAAAVWVSWVCAAGRVRLRTLPTRQSASDLK